MARMQTWIPLVVLIALVALAQPWRGGAAEARPAAKAAPCKAADVAKLRAELAATQAELAQAKVAVQKAQQAVRELLEAEKKRADRLADQLGSPMIETLKGSNEPLH